MTKENENLESTEETVEEVVADKDAEQEELDRQGRRGESIALASEKSNNAKRAKTKKTRDAGKPSSGGRFLGGLALVAVSALIGAGITYVSLGTKQLKKQLVSMKGDTVTVGDVFDSLKGSSQTQQKGFECNLQKLLKKNTVTRSAKKTLIRPTNKLQNSMRTILTSSCSLWSNRRVISHTNPYAKLVEYAVNQAAQKI